MPGRARVRGGGGAGEEREEPGHLHARLGGVPEDGAHGDLVPIATSVTHPLEVSVGLQVGDDRLHGALGESAGGGHIAQAYGRVSRDRHEHAGVIREESPIVSLRRGPHMLMMRYLIQVMQYVKVISCNS